MKPRRVYPWIATATCAASIMAARAQQPNAWQINDDNPVFGTVQYVTNLTAEQVASANANGWRYTLQARLLSDALASASHSMAFGDGTRRFYIFFDISTSGDLTGQLLSSSNVTYTLTSIPLSVTKYHLHELIYDPVTGNATYRFDGKEIATWSGQNSTGQSNQVMWGANSSTGRGVMHYRYARFEVPGEGVLATYDAGFAGNPVTAPSPTNQGWTRLSTAAVLPESALSPDAEFIHPIVITGDGTPNRPGRATLTATVHSGGVPMTYRFDHGLTTGYGATTPAGALPGAMEFVAVSNHVTGLPREVAYHFRAVGSNFAGQVVGADASVVVPEGPLVTSGPAGVGEPFDIRQPSIEVNYIICTNGSFPDQLNTVPHPFLGEIRLFAGNFAPAGWAFCHGQLLTLSNHLALASILQGSFGGDTTNFALPDLRSRTIAGVHLSPGQGWSLGERSGVTQVNLTSSQVPPHKHPLPATNSFSGLTGSGVPRQNQQPSTGISLLFCLTGNYPGDQQIARHPMLAQVVPFAGRFAPLSKAFATGQELSIAQNTALYSVIGDTYGGNQTFFALPDLRNRTPLGAGQGAGLTARSLGQTTGSESASLSVAQLPSHAHSIPWTFPFDNVTGSAGNNEAHTLMQPSFALRFLIATNGELPSPSTQATNMMLGEILMFAGTTMPGGWAPCEGQLLSIDDYPELFSVLSNRFGGDGTTTFALPDLRGRIPVGSADGEPGATYGSESIVLSESHMPVHTHSIPALDFDRWITGFGLADSAADFAADSDGDGVAGGFEWATGSNPTNAASFAPLSIRAVAENVFIEFPRNTNATDVVLSLQRAPDLSSPPSWAGIATNSGGAWAGNVAETVSTNPVTVSVIDAHTNTPSALYRLQVEWP